MPPKKSGAAGKQQNENAEEPLRALVLADAFETRFHPLTFEQPRCLLPLANTPLIEWTLEFLAKAGVAKVFIIAASHSKKVDEYIKKSRWAASTSPFDCEVIQTKATHLSEVMRDILQMKLFSGDFLMLYGDVVANLDIQPALKAHRDRRAKSKDAVATLLLRAAGDDLHDTKAKGKKPIFLVDPETERCLIYDTIPNKERTNRFNIDRQFIEDYDFLDTRHDLIDPGIDICTEEWLTLWEDYFDMKQPRSDFLSSVLKDHDLNGKTIHTYIYEDQYAARVRDLAAYNAISLNVISRWAYPFCPDMNLLKDQTYSSEYINAYRENNVVTARTSTIERRTVIGAGTNVGEGAYIRESVIGRNCSIGKNVRIWGAYLMDNVTVKEGSTIGKALLANEVVIGSNCTVENGALLSYRTRIADGKLVKGTSRITRTKALIEDDAEYPSIPSDSAVVGEDGIGFEYIEDGLDGEEPEMIPGLAVENTNILYEMERLALSVSTLHSDDEDDFDVERGHHDRSDGGSFVSVASVDSEGSQHHASNFDHEAAAGIFDSLEQGHETENIILELTTLRMSTNASDHQVRRAVAVALCKRVSQLVNTGRATKAAVSEVFSKHSELIRRSCISDFKQSNKVDQVDLLLLIQRDLIHREKGNELLLHIVTELYSIDRIEQEGIEQWWADSKSSEDEEMRQVREKTKSLIEFLEQDSEDSEEEDDDDDDDDEEDDDDE